MRAGIAETDAPGVSRSKLAASVAEHVPDEDERRWLEPRLGVPARPRRAARRRPRGALRRLADLLRADQRQGHGRAWCSRTCSGRTRGCWTSSSRCSSGRGTSRSSSSPWRDPSSPSGGRPGARASAASWRCTWSRCPTRRWPSSSGGWCPAPTPSRSTRIVERAEGMPLYAVEMIRMLADRGVLRAGDGAYELVGDLGELQVPETLHALIASRLDALGPEDRALLQDAAVLGQELHARWPRGGDRRRAADPRASAARPHAQGVPGLRGRPAFPRARPVRLRPGDHPGGRLRHALEGRPPRAAPGGGPPLRGRGRRRARRRRGRPLRRGAAGDAGRPRRARPWRPRPGLARPGGGAGDLARFTGAGAGVRRAGVSRSPRPASSACRALAGRRPEPPGCAPAEQHDRYLREAVGVLRDLGDSTPRWSPWVSSPCAFGDRPNRSTSYGPWRRMQARLGEAATTRCQGASRPRGRVRAYYEGDLDACLAALDRRRRLRAGARVGPVPGGLDRTAPTSS